MDQATISLVLGLLLKYGPEVAQGVHDLYERMKNGTPPTAEEVVALIKLASQTSSTQMTDALARNGIDPASTAGQNFTALAAQ